MFSMNYGGFSWERIGELCEFGALFCDRFEVGCLQI